LRLSENYPADNLDRKWYVVPLATAVQFSGMAGLRLKYRPRVAGVLSCCSPDGRASP